MTSELLPDFQQLLAECPGSFFVLAPDAPRFTIVAVTDAYLTATGKKRGDAGQAML